MSKIYIEGMKKWLRTILIRGGLTDKNLINFEHKIKINACTV